MAIVQMKKVSIVVMNSERKASLKKLRKMGLVHLEELEGKGPVLAAYKESSAAVEKALSILEEIKLPKKQQPAQILVDGTRSDSVARELVAMSERKKSLLDSISQNTQELDRLFPWGEVNPSDFRELADKGMFFYMYEIPEDKYSLIGSDVKTIRVNSSEKIIRFLLLSDSEVTERPAGLPPEAYAVPVPEYSTDELTDLIQNARNEISEIDGKITDSIKYHDSIVEYRKALASDIEFETVYSGMEHEEAKSVQDAEARSSEPETVESVLESRRAEEENPDGRLAWLTGYVPIDSLKDFTVACKQNDWAFAISDPADEDPVPTKLRNNKLVSLIYPLTDFLGTVPGYHEFDISGWFLLFFLVFFGMIFGDGGYGILLVAIMLVMMIKNAAGKKKSPPILGLGMLLGLSTIAWGAVTCTWFGIPMEYLPDWLKAISVPQISNAYSERLWTPSWVTEAGVGLTKDDNIKIFCFLLAMAQLTIAHVKVLVRNIAKGNPLKALGDLGTLMQLYGMFWIVLAMVVNPAVFPMMGYIHGVKVGLIAVILIGVGFALSFVFANYEGNIVKSILESLKMIISVLLGVVNIFSDIVSYIRLWAVGLAGAAISSTVNEMAGPILGHAFLFILAAVLLVFGHGMNMVLNLLSVIVHGVRLNTLEFSSHVGVSWCGTKYEPFREK